MRTQVRRWYEPEVESPVVARRFAESEQPLNLGRAILCGIFGAMMMMATIDLFNMMGWTAFSYEQFLGSLARGLPTGSHNWTWGFFLNWIVGALFGCVYALLFEYVFKRANAVTGVIASVLHVAFAAIAFFPLFVSIHSLIGTGLYPQGFGFLGWKLGRVTPFLIVVSHLLFGLTMGWFYGPVRESRIHARAFEPGETGLPGEPGVIMPEDDPIDRVVV